MKKRMLAVFVVMSILVTSLFALLPASAEEAPTKQEVMPLASNASVMFWEFGTGEVVAFKVTAAAAFDGAYIYLANSGQNSVLNVKVYAWKTDYATTTAGTAVVDQNVDVAAWRGDDYNTRETTGTEIKFGKTVEAGDYLVAYSEVSGSITHSINMVDSRAAGVEFFRNGSAPRSEWDTIVGGLLYKQVTPATVLWGEIGGGDAYFLYGNDAKTARTIAVRFNALNAFKQLKLGVNGGDKLTYTLYAWNGDYETTVAGKAVKTVTDEAKLGSAVATIELGEAVAKGEYLLVVAPASSTPSDWVSIWTKASLTPDLVDYYCNGVLQEDETTETVGNSICALYRCMAGGIVYVDDTVTTLGALGEKPNDNPTTGDAELFMLAVTAVLACGIAVLIRRKKNAYAL